jgi:hypothetical protein
VEGADLLGRNLDVLQKTLSYRCVQRTRKFWTSPVTES